MKHPNAVSSASDDATTAESLPALYRRWDAVRRRTSLREGGDRGGLARAVGFLRRTLLRIRDLGISADRQRDLLQALVDRVETVDGRIAALEACQGDILGALDVIWQWREQQSRSALSGQAAPPEDLANLHDRQEALRVRLARFEGALADLREELDGLRGGPQRSRAWPKA